MSPLKKLLSQDLNILSWINKYSIVVLLFVIWLSFFDRYSLITQYRLSKTMIALEKEQTNYEHQLEEAIKARKTINNDVEKFARENYLFHKDNETIIIIEPEDKSNSKKRN